MGSIVRWAGIYEFQAATHGGWTVYVNDLTTLESKAIGHWPTLDAAHEAVGAPPFDEEEDIQMATETTISVRLEEVESLLDGIIPSRIRAQLIDRLEYLRQDWVREQVSKEMLQKSLDPDGFFAPGTDAHKLLNKP